MSLEQPGSNSQPISRCVTRGDMVSAWSCVAPVTGQLWWPRLIAMQCGILMCSVVPTG